MKKALITLAVLLAAVTGFGQSHPAVDGDFVIPDGGTTSQAIHVKGYGIAGIWIGPTASGTPTTLTVTMAPNALTEPAAGLFATVDSYSIPAGVASGSVYVEFDLGVTPCLQWTKMVVDVGPTGETWPIDINYTPRMAGPLNFSSGDFALGVTDSLFWGGDAEIYRSTTIPEGKSGTATGLCFDDGDKTDCDLPIGVDRLSIRQLTPVANYSDYDLEVISTRTTVPASIWLASHFEATANWTGSNTMSVPVNVQLFMIGASQSFIVAGVRAGLQMEDTSSATIGYGWTGTTLVKDTASIGTAYGLEYTVNMQDSGSITDLYISRINGQKSGTPTVTNSTGLIITEGSFLGSTSAIGIKVDTGAAAAIPIVVEAHASQTANLIDVTNSGGTTIARVTATGDVEAPSFLFPNGAGIYSGTGSPEGAVTANPGSLYTDRNGGAGTTLYAKESGTGNTGWVAK